MYGTRETVTARFLFLTAVSKRRQCIIIDARQYDTFKTLPYYQPWSSTQNIFRVSVRFHADILQVAVRYRVSL